MRTRRLAATAVAASFLAMGMGGMAQASDTEVSFTVDANTSGLSISQSGSTATLLDGVSNPIFNAAGAETVSGTLPTTTVTDVRGTLAGAWTVTVSGEDWVHQTDGSQTIDQSNGHVYLDAATLGALTTALGGALDGMILTSAELNVGVNDLTSSYTLMAGTTTLGDGSVDFTPTIDVTIPSGSVAGVYSATVTQTVS